VFWAGDRETTNRPAGGAAVLRGISRRFAPERRGLAAVEVGVASVAIVLAALNVADVGRFAYQSAVVTAAAQAGAQAAKDACNIDHIPATLDCRSLYGAVTNAVQNSPLGAQVTLRGPITEGYYCMTMSRGLAAVGELEDGRPEDCSAVPAVAGATPTLYLQVRVITPFSPLFRGLTVANAFSDHIARTVWIRMEESPGA